MIRIEPSEPSTAMALPVRWSIWECLGVGTQLTVAGRSEKRALLGRGARVAAALWPQLCSAGGPEGRLGLGSGLGVGLGLGLGLGRGCQGDDSSHPARVRAAQRLALLLQRVDRDGV